MPARVPVALPERGPSCPTLHAAASHDQPLSAAAPLQKQPHRGGTRGGEGAGVNG